MTARVKEEAAAVQTAFKKDLDKVLVDIRTLLVEKNRKYGDSALNPIRVFSKASPTEQIRVRIDDKLTRIVAAESDEDEDVYKDLLGYLIIMEIAKLRERETQNAAE